AQLVYGPVSDRFGRRPVLLWGIGVYILGSLICLAAPGIEVLIAGRVVQAVGGCAGIVLGRAMIRDIHDGARAASMLAYVVMAMVLAPMVAPTIGGLLDVWFGWWASFVLMVGVGIATFLASLAFAHETHHGQRPVLGGLDLLVGFAYLLRRRRFCGYVFMVAFTGAMFHGFLAGAPYVMVEILGRSPVEYGLYFIVTAGAFAFGNFLAGRLTGRFGGDRMIGVGLSMCVGAGMLPMLFMFAGALTPVTLFLPFAVVSVGQGLCMANGIMGAIGVEPSRIGAASGLAGFLQMMVGGAAAFAVGSLIKDSAAPLTVGVVIVALLGAAAFYWGVRREPKAA
ncbi:MAG: multidrug effflux MFS transporter, partial [Alphaproteobacteria bacterium]